MSDGSERLPSNRGGHPFLKRALSFSSPICRPVKPQERGITELTVSAESKMPVLEPILPTVEGSRLLETPQRYTPSKAAKAVTPGNGLPQIITL